jgi:transcriptional regulator of acetoin/glycerol metabolism
MTKSSVDARAESGYTSDEYPLLGGSMQVREADAQRFPDPTGERQVMEAWERFLAGDGAPPHVVRDLIGRSWWRCLSAGVDPGRTQSPLVLPGEERLLVRERHRELIEATAQVMAQARDFLSESGTFMLLTDPSGVILQAEGDGRALEAATDIRLMPGANWNELTCGTNAIGTALSTHAPVQVHGGEHFCAGIKRWTCSAVVVRDLASGEILGALDVSGLQATYDRHCLALVIAVAGRIEAQLAAREAERRARVLDEGLGRLSRIASGGLLFFDRKGRLIRADARAGLSLAAMGIEPAGWNDARITVPTSDSPPGARSELPEWLRPEWVEPVVDRGEPIGAIVALPRPPHVGASTAASGSGGSKARESAALPVGPFARIIGNTPALRQAIEKARVLADLDVPVLLQGETGVGKEVFAHAIHESGRRWQQGPFVVLNCGGLPRDILASELFGYVEGAFTGARRSGMIGKIEAANRGTLFLDEIGEMPIDVQPFFLRALEGGEVYPVGSSSPRKVQFRLITASNRDLKAEVTAGRFRMDLFYRVSVTSIRIPSLADRKEDIPALVERFSRDVAKRHAIPMRRFDPDVLVVFDCYQWPGNIRELRNVVESMVLLTDGDVVGPETLPHEVAAAAQRRFDPGPAAGRAAGLEGVEREAIADAIRRHGGNLKRVAGELRISKSTLYAKIKKYVLEIVLEEVRHQGREA